MITAGRLVKKLLKRPYFVLYIILMTTVLCTSAYEIRFLQSAILIKDIKLDGINYDAFRSMYISEKTIDKADRRISRIIKKYPVLNGRSYIDTIGYLTFSMLVRDYDMLKDGVPDEKTFLKGMAKVAVMPNFKELYGYYKACLSDLMYFPVPKIKEATADVTFDDSWFAMRNYGGRRRHEGTDIVASNNIRGYFPIVSMTDGTVEKMGWLDQGGYRIGIRSVSGAYFYYAHLSSYAPGLKEGDSIIAGQLLGFMGDSGYGSEGTVGKFDVHLHLGIYVPADTGDMSLNPYYILRMLEDNRTQFSKQTDE